MRFITVAVCLAFTCAPRPVASQAEEPGGSDAAFLELIADAVRRQPDFGSQQAAVGQARGALSEAKAGLLPRVQLLVDSGERRAVRNDRLTDSPDGRGSGQVTPQLALTQLLYDGGAAWGRVRASKVRVSAASRGADAAANTLALQAVQSYFTVLRQREALSIAAENVRKVQGVRDKVAERVAEGRDPHSELSRLDSRVLEARNQLVDAQRDLDDAGAAYEEIFGASSESIQYPASSPGRREAVADALAYARAHNPQVLALREERDATAADYDSERAAMMWPRLSLEAVGTAYDAFGSDGVEDRDTYVGLRISYDLYAGGANGGRSRQAGGRLLAARLAVERAELALDRRIRQAYSAVEARERQAATMNDRVRRDRQAIEDYEELFLAGRRTLNDLIVAQRDYFASAMQFLDVQLDLRVQQFSLLALTGELAQYFGIEPQSPPGREEGGGR